MNPYYFILKKKAKDYLKNGIVHSVLENTPIKGYEFVTYFTASARDSFFETYNKNFTSNYIIFKIKNIENNNNDEITINFGYGLTNINPQMVNDNITKIEDFRNQFKDYKVIDKGELTRTVKYNEKSSITDYFKYDVVFDNIKDRVELTIYLKNDIKVMNCHIREQKEFQKIIDKQEKLQKNN